MNRDTTHVNGDSPHVNVESTHVSLPSLTAGRDIYALCFEWTDLSCELSQQLRSTHHCSAKKTSSFKEGPMYVSLLGMCNLQSLTAQGSRQTGALLASRTWYPPAHPSIARHLIREPSPQGQCLITKTLLPRNSIQKERS